MYKYMNDALPRCFSSWFTLTSNIHSYSTRSTAKKNLFVCFNRTSLFKNSFVQREIQFWNSLNENIKTSLTRKKKKKINYLMQIHTNLL